MSRFLIRPYREHDVAGLYAAADESRREIARWMGWMSDAYSPEDTAAWVRQAIDSWQAAQAYEHVITDAADGSIVGACGLNLLNRVNGFCNLGYWVRASRFGEGAGRAATLTCSDATLNALDATPNCFTGTPNCLTDALNASTYGPWALIASH